MQGPCPAFTRRLVLGGLHFVPPTCMKQTPVKPGMERAIGDDARMNTNAPATPSSARKTARANRTVWIALIGVVLVILSMIALSLKHKYDRVDPRTGQHTEGA